MAPYLKAARAIPRWISPYVNVIRVFHVGIEDIDFSDVENEEERVALE